MIIAEQLTDIEISVVSNKLNYIKQIMILSQNYKLYNFS